MISPFASKARTIFTLVEEKKYKDIFLDSLMYELYNLSREVAFSVNLIIEKKAEVIEHQDEIKALEEKLPEGRNKLTPKASKEYKETDQKIAGFKFMIETANKKLATLYTEIATKGNQIRSFEKNIASVRALDLTKVPQLPFIVVNGTKYQADNNMPKLDDKGIMMLYVEKHSA